MSSPPEPTPANQGRTPVDPAGAVPPPPPPGFGYYPPPAPPRQRGILGRLLTGLVTSVLLISLLLNAYFILFFIKLTAGPNEQVYQEGAGPGRIVILPVEGFMNQEMASFLHEALKHLEEDRPSAIILRIDSGGGLVSAADRIWNDLTRFQQKTHIPVVASFGGVAASGGYYVAAPADFIVAEPTNITGSIGVIAQAFTVEQLMQKIGVTPQVITSTPATKKDFLNPMRPWTDAERQKLRGILDSAHARFVEVVAKGRGNKLGNKSEAEALAVVQGWADGDIYTIAPALEKKLVDQEGYLEDAIVKAAALAQVGAATPRVTIMHPPSGLWLAFRISAKSQNPDAQAILSMTPAQAREWLIEATALKLEYRWVP